MDGLNARVATEVRELLAGVDLGGPEARGALPELLGFLAEQLAGRRALTHQVDAVWRGRPAAFEQLLRAYHAEHLRPPTLCEVFDAPRAQSARRAAELAVAKA